MRGIYSTQYEVFHFKSWYIMPINDKILNYFRFSNDGIVSYFVNNTESQYKIMQVTVFKIPTMFRVCKQTQHGNKLM